MLLYSALDRVLPRSYLAKVVGVAVLCGQIPLLLASVAVLLGIVPPGWAWPVVLGAAVLGCATLTFALAAVLAPVSRLEEAFSAFEAGRRAEGKLPEHHRDPVGRLMARAAQTMRVAETRIDAAERLADRDPLTKLLNRRGMERRIAQRRGPGERGAILMMDLDHFKRVNDTYGHDEGDRVLCALADLLSTHMRRPDLAARFGGEEFVVYLSGLGREAALRVAERLRMAIEDRIFVAGAPQTVSIGVAPWSHGERFDDVLRRADAAVYAAKDAGRNRVRFAPPVGSDAAVSRDPEAQVERTLTADAASAGWTDRASETRLQDTSRVALARAETRRSEIGKRGAA